MAFAALMAIQVRNFRSCYELVAHSPEASHRLVADRA